MMARVNSPGENVRRFIVGHVEKYPSDIAKVTARHFTITRQAVNKHLQKLVAEGALTESGKTRSRIYRLAALSGWRQVYEMTRELEEDVVWANDVSPALGQLQDNVKDIWHHGFTEMFNNALDHSGGQSIAVEILKTAASAEMLVQDDGVGIFRKIQREFGLLDERHAILELSKGKLTTDPKHHSGEGIFFTSRMFDSFEILSGGAYFLHQHGRAGDWLLETNRENRGTAVFMRLHNHTSRTTKKIFDAYVSGDDFDFTKTVVPVSLARYGTDKLVSRSQAKRVLARIESFKTVAFDFKEVDSIGRAFADEIFRVFAASHPDIELHVINANSEVKRMVSHARGGVKLTSELAEANTRTTAGVLSGRTDRMAAKDDVQ